MPEIWDVYDENRNKTGKTMLRSDHPRGKMNIILLFT